MRFARDFGGLLVDAERNDQHGNFICPQCHNLAHWRKLSVDLRSPHFYHAVANEDCPLSVIGGTWELIDIESVEYSNETISEKIIYQKKTKPNLNKIIKKYISDSEFKKEISEYLMKIRLSSVDVSQIDHTVSIFCKFFRKNIVGIFCAIPLPVKIVTNRNIALQKQRIHRRLIHIIGSTPKIVEELSFLNIPKSVRIEFGTLNLTSDIAK